jgi:hypothetical protein
MLVIRDQQMETLRRQRLGRFRELLVHDLTIALQDVGISWSRTEIERQANRGAGWADSAGVTRECDVARFTILVCIHLGGFGEDELPQSVYAIAGAFGVTPEVRLQRLESWLVHYKVRQAYAG